MFCEKRLIHRKKMFDEDDDKEIRLSANEYFCIEFFICIADQAISSIKTVFEQFVEYENNFGFLFDLEKLKSLNESILQKYCIDLENFLKVGEHSDIDGYNLFSELRVLREILRSRINTPIMILDYVKKLDSFPNTSISYKILLMVPIIVASTGKSFF